MAAPHLSQGRAHPSKFHLYNRSTTTPGGRKLLPHDRAWEWQAQRHLRQLSQLIRPGDLVLIGRQASKIVACAHLKLDHDNTTYQVFIAALGVSVDVRGQGGTVADEMIEEIVAQGQWQALTAGTVNLAIACNIHGRNLPSQRLVIRAGLEPYGAPTRDYQLWARLIRL